jgi:hypothetical protein
MNVLKQNIEDLKVIQSGYPESSRGYEALRLAIVVLTQTYDGNACVQLNHWVVGEGAGSANENITAAPSEAWFTLED